MATSTLVKSIGWANIADVASLKVSPPRLAGIQSPLGTRTPDVVPFQVKSTSRSKSTLPRSGSRPYSASITRRSWILSCLTASVTQPLPKLSQASASTPRAPSMVHMAISKAPVSEAGTIPHT